MLSEYYKLSRANYLSDNFKIKSSARAFNGYLETLVLYINNPLSLDVKSSSILDTEILINMTIPYRENVYKDKLKNLKGLKVNEAVKVIYSKDGVSCIIGTTDAK